MIHLAWDPTLVLGLGGFVFLLLVLIAFVFSAHEDYDE